MFKLHNHLKRCKNYCFTPFMKLCQQFYFLWFLHKNSDVLKKPHKLGKVEVRACNLGTHCIWIKFKKPPLPPAQPRRALLIINSRGNWRKILEFTLQTQTSKIHLRIEAQVFYLVQAFPGCLSKWRLHGMWACRFSDLDWGWL